MKKLIAVLTVVAGVSASSLDTPTSTRANSYDDGWQSDWVAHASSLLRSATNQKTNGFVLALGDSITHSYAFAMWPVGGAGKTSSDADVTSWAHTGSWGATISTSRRRTAGIWRRPIPRGNAV